MPVPWKIGLQESSKFYGLLNRVIFFVLLNLSTSNVVMAQSPGEAWLKICRDLDSLPRDTSLVDRLIDAGYHRYNFKGDSVYHYSDRAIDLATKIDYTKGIVSANNLKGSYANSQNNHADAIRYFEEAIRINKGSNNPLREAQLRGNLANVFTKSGQYDSSISIKLQNLQVFKSYADSASLEACLGGIGWLFERKKDYAKASTYFRNSLKFSRSKRTRAYTLGNIGIAKKHLGQLDSALYYYRLAASTYPDHLQFNGDNYQNVALLFLQRGAWDSCHHYFELAAQNLGQLDDSIHLALLDLNWSEVFLKEERLTESASKIEVAADRVKSNGTLRQQIRLASLAAAVYEKMNQPSQVVTHLRDKIRLQDSLNIVEVNSRLTEIETRYQTLEKEKQILEQQVAIELQQEKQQQLRYVVIGMALLAGIIIYLIAQRAHFRKVKLEYDLERQQFQIDTLEKNNQIDTLHATLAGEENERKRIAGDLHDSLGALLSAVKLHFRNIEQNLEQMRKLQPLRKASELLDEATSEVRRIAHNMMPASLLEFGLVSSLEDQVVDLREQGYEVSWTNGGHYQRIDGEKEMMIYRIVQELVQNIHKHAQARHIDVTFHQDVNQLTIGISDDGVGFDETSTKPGLGLQSIRSRVQFLEGEVTWTSSPGLGSQATLKVPF